MREGGGEAGGGLTLLVSGGWLSWSPPRGDCPFGTKATRGWDPPSAPLRGPSSPPRYACDPAAAAVGGGGRIARGGTGEGGGEEGGGNCWGAHLAQPAELVRLGVFPDLQLLLQPRTAILRHGACPRQSPPRLCPGHFASVRYLFRLRR